MLTLEQIRAAIKNENAATIAEQCGLSRQSIWKIQTGRAKKPSYEMIKLLSDYIISKGWNTNA